MSRRLQQAIRSYEQTKAQLDPEKDKDLIKYTDEQIAGLQSTVKQRMRSKIKSEKMTKEYGGIAGMVSSLGALLTDLDKQFLGEKGFGAVSGAIKEKFGEKSAPAKLGRLCLVGWP